MHLYPIEHDKHLSEPFEDSSALDNQRNNRKSLNVCVLGIPNAGKSTLINNIIGANACPHSKKAHTTRKLSNALLTEDNIQIVFSDTPGVVKPGDVQKFRLEETLIRDPIEATTAADLVIVLHGMYCFWQKILKSIDRKIKYYTKYPRQYRISRFLFSSFQICQTDSQEKL